MEAAAEAPLLGVAVPPPGVETGEGSGEAATLLACGKDDCAFTADLKEEDMMGFRLFRLVIGGMAVGDEGG